MFFQGKKCALFLLVTALFAFVPVFSAGSNIVTDYPVKPQSFNRFLLQKLDYTDHLLTLPNYDRGFYHSQGLHIKVNGTKPIEKPYGKLVHLRADIAEFSSNAWLGIDSTLGDTIWGKSQDLTDDALNVLQKTFDNIRNDSAKVIVRICYDPWFDGHSNTTPEHKWVLRHIEQLAPVLSKNVDVIVALEMGMHGAFGEMHSDTSITYPRVAEAVNKMLQMTPSELKILTRTGNYSAAVLGFENWGVDFNIESEVFKQIEKAKGDTMYRVGMFNDGYLGTQYDYGTWGSDCETSICREEGVAWLEKYSINTPYGGEAVATASGYEVINTPEFLAHEGFRTHTSYLNLHWNPDVINSWKTTHFNGKDYEYDGTLIDSLTGYKYIEDHLGYRFVLRESWLPDTVFANEWLNGMLKIQNVGFGNLTKKRNVKFVFVTNECQNETLSKESYEQCMMLDTISTSMRDTIEFEIMDFRNIHSRTLKVTEFDTVITFDGMNEIKYEIKVPFTSYYFKLFLIVDDVYFANISSYESGREIYLGTFLATSKEKFSESIISNKLPKSNATMNYVERINQKIQVRDMRNSHQLHGDNVDRFFYVNGRMIQ